jgi:putative transposase
MVAAARRGLLPGSLVRRPVSWQRRKARLVETLSPKNHAERVAIFRHTVVGSLVVREFCHGELRAELEALSRQRFRPPDADSTRCYSVPTLERWYYACKKCGPQALVPKSRADKGHGRKLTAEMRELLCDIRADNRSASVPTILTTLQDEGLLPTDPEDEHAVSPQTVCKLYAARGLKRISAKAAANADPHDGPSMRLKWQAAYPGALWHGDVCHFVIVDTGVRKPVRIHGHLDDNSRYVPAIEAFWTEREEDMLELFIDAVRVHGPPDALYLDNGPTYIGDALITVCQRIGTLLLHPKPHDPQARGKMERFWRTLREGLLAFCNEEMSLEELNRRLRAFVDRYHHTPHAGLMGRTPASVYRAHKRVDDLDEQKLRTALLVRETRRVSHDNLVSIDGVAWELDQGFLAGKRVTIVRSLLMSAATPCVELEGKLLPLHPVDPIHNAKRKRPALHAPEPCAPSRPGVAFNPVSTLLKAKRGGRS